MGVALYSGECTYKNMKFEYVIKKLEYIPDKSLKMEAVCYDPESNTRQAYLEHSSYDLESDNELNKICILIAESLIKKLNINKYDLIKLSVRDGKTYYMYEAK